MFDIAKLLERQSAREDKITKLVKYLKESGKSKLCTRKELRNMQGFERCCPRELRKLKQKLQANNIVIIGDVSTNQDDYVHLVYKYSKLYRDFKHHFRDQA